MIIWIVVLIVIAISMLSGDFAGVTEDFFTQHALVILLAALGMLCWAIYQKKKSDL